METTRAPVNDEKALSSIHTDLAEKDLLPDQHLVDAGYVDATNLIQSRVGYGVDLVGPTLKNYWYQAETGYDVTHFSIDWETETVTCPPSVTPVRAGRLLKMRKANPSSR